jgi:hypothetical protein
MVGPGNRSAVTTWQELAESAASCTRCDLYRRATETVFGEGNTTAAMVLSFAGLVADLVTAREAAGRGGS